MCQVWLILFNTSLITKNNISFVKTVLKRRFKSSRNLWNRDMNVKNILASLSRIFLRWNSFWYSFEACFNFNLIIVRISHCKRKKTMVFLKEQSSHATTRLLGGWRATFHTSIASEIRDEACDCRTPLFFLCRSLN